MIVLLNLREYLGTVHVLPLADHSGLLFRLAALCPALLEVSLHFDLEAAILFALPHEFIIVFRVELNRQRVVVAGQRAAFPRLGFYPDRAARLEIAVDFDFAPRLGFESQCLDQEDLKYFQAPCQRLRGWLGSTRRPRAVLMRRLRPRRRPVSLAKQRSKVKSKLGRLATVRH